MKAADGTWISNFTPGTDLAVTAAVQRVDPQATLKIELPTHRVQIESGQPREAFTAALAEEGYAAA